MGATRVTVDEIRTRLERGERFAFLTREIPKPGRNQTGRCPMLFAFPPATSSNTLMKFRMTAWS